MKKHTEWVNEFSVRDKEFVKYLILKLFAFTIDYSIVLALVFIINIVIDIPIVIKFLYIFAFGLAYNITTISLFKWTFGTLLTKLRIVHKSGYFTTSMQHFTRGFIGGINYLPFMGWVVCLVNIFVAIIYKGLTITDYLSQTVLVSNHKYNILKANEASFLAQEKIDGESMLKGKK